MADSKSRPTVYYIAGPMTGRPEWGRPEFALAEKTLRDLGFKVINPGCLPVDLPGEVYMPICLAMLQQADAVVMLPGWADSEGARLEFAFARKCGKPVSEYAAYTAAKRGGEG